MSVGTEPITGALRFHLTSATLLYSEGMYMQAAEIRHIPTSKLHQPMTYSDEVKFLGVILDTRLNLSKHIQRAKGKAIKRTSILRCLAGEIVVLTDLFFHVCASL